MSATASDIRFDLDLTERDIQALSSVDAVAAFFARLGYDTNARIVQTPGNLGIGTEGTLRPIKRIELIAYGDGCFRSMHPPSITAACDAEHAEGSCA